LYEFDKPGTTLAGLGCGLLAASAVAVSPTLADLAVAGAQSIRIAFRLGIHVYEISSLLEAPLADPESESWAYVVPGLSADVVQAEIDNYNQRTVGPHHVRKAFRDREANREIVKYRSHLGVYKRLRQNIG
jgi:asperthecin polyketide synthase